MLSNTLTNSRPRQTPRSVVAFDLVGASHWVVSDNLVTNIVKRDGNQVSYAMFMKGASEGGRFERNLVICSPREISRPGERVGISFGGGTTDPAVCRTGGCQNFEHRGGFATNNIIAHCNDSGLDINHSSMITFAHNTLINTSGIVLRRNSADAMVYGNLVDGAIRSKQNINFTSTHNVVPRVQSIFVNPLTLDLDWKRKPVSIPSYPHTPDDFCKHRRKSLTLPGATVDEPNCAFPVLR